MTNVLIRGLSDETVARIDRSAAELGLSRNEYLRRRLEGDTPRPTTKTSDEDWKRSGQIFADLADPDVMADAWR
ncbi:type II toxin-antitoxin system VapB family antitoxin [Microlunatus sp. Y2014]|uniref:type II toxin-antitoxin system VapB family antitoxin n=1 Tax=Microlunatus sp. Y2014 TaxID=3418488 RepID=UPI003DA7451C